MLDAHWLLFTVASLVLIATPGQDMILVMSRSVAQGPHAGVATAAGVSLGLVGHTVLATLGLGAILAASELLFTILKFVGAAYLIYLAIGLLRARSTEIVMNRSRVRSMRRLFADGALSTCRIRRSPSSTSRSCRSSWRRLHRARPSRYSRSAGRSRC